MTEASAKLRRRCVEIAEEVLAEAGCRWHRGKEGNDGWEEAGSPDGVAVYTVLIDAPAGAAMQERVLRDWGDRMEEEGIFWTAFDEALVEFLSEATPEEWRELAEVRI